MAGLLQRQAPQGAQPGGMAEEPMPAQQPAGPQQPMTGGQPAGDAPQGGGDPQQMLAVLLDAMLNSLYEPQVAEGVEEILQTWDNPVEAMGRAIHDVMMITIGLLEREGRMVPPEVMLEAGVELARAVGEMAIAMGEVDESDELAIEMGLFIALAMVGDDIQGDVGQQYRAMGQQLAEQRMSMIDPSELDEETLALVSEQSPQGGA